VRFVFDDFGATVAGVLVAAGFVVVVADELWGRLSQKPKAPAMTTDPPASQSVRRRTRLSPSSRVSGEFTYSLQHAYIRQR
jgi:hypothetical protein